MTAINKPYRRYKILILGESSVGKTSILCRFTDDTFKYAMMNTIGIDFVSKDITIDGERVKLQIWDTAGQERFHSITRSYYRSANGIFLVFDVCDARSFDSVDQWYQGIRNEVGEEVPVFLIGNKMDEIDANDERLSIYKEKGLNMGIPYYETSARTGLNIENIFKEMAMAMKNKAFVFEEELEINTNRSRKGCC
ncbi:Ras-related protein Rab-1A [Astathelohania contejeani]|uniref:Ras-related protein Rab-1A n=1 Tax=Astathelohania contejeani TaxID=164912 RepID=A0ABQ7I0L5_9MICR|nr:Ras-related protein Rab-1A [Thelohania contejeani]